jgi:hypothetical protein
MHERLEIFDESFVFYFTNILFFILIILVTKPKILGAENESKS